jgi:pimeloyl-ACP methyl ester carboxylesterase
MQHIILLHGAAGAMDQLAELEKNLADSLLVHRFNFSGHGGLPFSNEPFSIPSFAEEVIRFLDKKEIESAHIFGYSMGGYVAMYLAKFHPHRVNKIITLATKFNWNENIASKEVKMLDPEVIEKKVPAFAAVLQKRHAPNNWKTVLEKTSALLIEMGKDNPLKPVDYKNIRHQTLILLGDLDKMVTTEETREVYQLMPHAKMAILADTPHPVEMVNTAKLVSEIRAFILNTR